jgi:chromosome segregation protein
MYLKEIRAQGFKSFADKMIIELDKNITGIVGPNGSGKSNIVDAIKWVLGEQSIKSLRGEDGMTDVIFSGSKSRKPLNSASVSLVFENSDHYLNLPTSEIVIKRRVYVDGTNEYFINGEKCRLKDITNLLLDSGMSKESYNIISQGKIEEIINSKPVERRTIFEEAAGVLKYKKRKEEALRKLSKTKDNLIRINDIIIELESQLEPLETQKKQALVYVDLKDSLTNVEVSLLAHEIKNNNDRYQVLKQEILMLNDEIIKLSSKTTLNEAKISEFNNKMSKLDVEINMFQTRLLEQTKLVEQINSQKQIVMERSKYEVEDIKYHNNLLALKEEQLSLQMEINNKEKILKDLENDLNNHMSIIDLKSKEINKIVLTRKEFEEKIYSLNKTRLINKTKIDQLRDIVENNGGFPESVRKVLSNPKLAGIIDALVNIIDIDEKYLKAISIALGPALNNIVCEDEISIKEAVRYLKETNSGRATFLPMNSIRTKVISDNILEPVKDKIVGRASDLVMCDSKYKSVLENQLGNVIIVKDYDTAIYVSEKLDKKYRIVSLEGEVIHAYGSITGGSYNQSRNLIDQKRQLNDLLKEELIIDHELLIIEDKINQVDNELKAIEDKFYILNKEKIKIEQTYITLSNQRDLEIEKLEQITLEQKSINSILNQDLKDEQKELLEQFYNEISKKNDIERELSNLKKLQLNFKEEHDTYIFETKKENSLFLEKNNALKNSEIEANRIEVKLDSDLNYLGETYNMTFEYALEHFPLVLKESEAKTQVNGLKRKLREIGFVNLGAIEEFDRINDRYSFLIKQRDDLFEAEKTLLEIIKEMDIVMIEEFKESFEIIRSNFKQTFKDLFKGGHADLKLTDIENLLDTGIEIIASPPGKQLSSISLLSGGEKTLTAISLLFAILKSREVPFCILDEAEAALDEVNVDSFGDYITNLKQKTQFILITHKKKTMEYADTLYGLTMQESGVSKLVSVKLQDM